MEIVKVKNGQIEVAKELVKEIVEFEKQALQMKLKQEELKASLKKAMEENNIVFWETEGLKVSYRRASERTTVDSKRLKKEVPDIYEEYSKTSQVASSISLSIE